MAGTQSPGTGISHPLSAIGPKQVTLDTWVARGLTREVLLMVAREVFSLDLTGGGPEACAPGRGDVELSGE